MFAGFCGFVKPGTVRISTGELVSAIAGPFECEHALWLA
jgi:hypothetical protein